MMFERRAYLSPLVICVAVTLLLMCLAEPSAPTKLCGSVLGAPKPPLPLSQHACLDSPRFAYLVTIAGESLPAHGDFAALLKDPDVASFYSTWRVRLGDFPFHPGSFGENRNFLLERAVAAERLRGCRFTYYIFVDEHTPMLTLSAETAAIDGVRTDVAPYLAWRELLLEWMPAVGYPRYIFMPQFDPKRSYPAHSLVNFDHVMLAVHFSAARLLLPYAIDIEPFHWWQAQGVMIVTAAMLYLESSLEFRSFLSFPKVPHNSSSTGMKPWDPEMLVPYVRNALSGDSPLYHRVLALSTTPVDGLERRHNASVRYDIDVSALGIKPDHAIWTRANSFWARLGAANSACAAGFCDLVNISEYISSIIDCAVQRCQQ